MKRYKAITLICIILLLLTSCATTDNKSKINSDKIVNIAIIFSEVGLGDKSYNDLCYEGILKAQEEFGIEFDYSQAENKDDYEALYIEYARTRNYDLIIGLGAEQEKAIIKVSAKFPNQKFTIMDSSLDFPNISSICTNWSEQTFLNGIIAGLSISKNKDSSEKLVGVILGKNLKYLNEGAIGFEAGVKYINSNIEVIRAEVGNFNNPSKAKEIALLMYQKGAKYIQQIAGESGFGAFAAAKETGNYVFGVDANQNSFEPDYIVSTATRYADRIIYNEIKSIVNNTWKPGIKKEGIKEGVVGYTTEGSKVKLDADIIKTVEFIKKSIINKEIKVPSTYEELEKFITLK